MAEARRQEDWSALMARAQDGDGGAYVVLLQSLTPYLRSLARRAGFGADEIEDGVQDILLTVHAIRHTYDRARPFGPWLVAVARNRLADRMRRLARRGMRETALTEFHETFVADAANLPEQASDARRLREAIATLPEGQRRAVEMLKLEELTLHEAAERTGISETALKVSVHRAIKRLRAILGGDGA